jgi:tetratricopeptide (TPR) repeat protein
LRFENLGPDASADWMGRALSELVTASLAGSPSVYAIPPSSLRAANGALGPRPVGAPGVSVERPAAFGAGADRIVYGQFSTAGGAVRVNATVEDAASGKMMRALSASGADVFRAAASLAAQLGGTAPPATRNPAALRDYVDGIEQPDPARAAESLARAVAADPSFAQAWLAAAANAIQRNDAPGALRFLETASMRSGTMAAPDRARIDYEAALLRGDNAGRRRALTAWMQAAPADPDPPALLAGLAEADHDYRRAAALLHSAAGAYPANATLLNNLGYAEAYAGNLDAAVAALDRYRESRPRDPNPLDSLGDVHLYFGKLRDAERDYLESYAKDPRFNDGGALLKAAWAHLLGGDIRGANTVFQRYQDARREDPAAEYRRAEWLWVTGRRKAALEMLSGFAAARENGPARELAARARAHLAIWLLETGDAAAARAQADKAVALAGPAGAPMAAVALFLTEPPASSTEWAVRAERLFPAPGAAGVKNFALACALLFAREYGAASPLLKEVYARWTPAADPAIPVMLAWAYTGSERARDAAALLARNPIPQGAGLNVFTSLWFPRLFFLRAETLAAEGKSADARENYQLFLNLSGPTPLAWGEERRAAAQRLKP